MKRPIAIKIFPRLHDEALELLAKNRQKYRSFTAMVETALAEYIEKEKSNQNQNKNEK
jgi:predicted transcriptional regulator